MSIDVLGPGGLDYLPCRYGASKLLFRGPKRSLDQPYVAFIGGTETYGKFIKTPYPALVERSLGLTCANFGFLNAGVDAFVRDPFVLEAAANSEVTVIQVLGAQNMTNRFYAVHPRRNDRFVSASKLLGTIYREVDFAEYHFNKHMLGDLLALSPDRFAAVRSELQEAWLARMRLMLGEIKGKIVLLWFAPHLPCDASNAETGALGDDPLFVTAQMIEQISPLVTEVVQVQPSQAALNAGTKGMTFNEMESVAARHMMGPLAHAEAAQSVIKAIERL